MLKSVWTQIAATLFFGPLGLAYTSVATAVFLTLVLAVLLFTELGVIAIFLIWPVSILVGLIYVKLHNDAIRSSGSRLLLGPGEEAGLISTLGSWTRGLAVCALVVTGAYLFYLYLPQNDQGSKLGRIVGVESTADVESSNNEQAVPVSSEAVIAANSRDNSDQFAVIALPQREVKPVVLDNEGNVTTGDSQSALNAGQPELTVSGAVVNLRQGPGTNFPIVTQVEQGDRLFEFARDGQWINVETETTGYSGWIYGTLVR